MKTLEQKINEVASGAAASNPYVINGFYDTMMEAYNTANAIFLSNLGDTYTPPSSVGGDGEEPVQEPSEYDKIEEAWNGWSETYLTNPDDPASEVTIVHAGFLTSVADIIPKINSIRDIYNYHYENYWKGEYLNYKNRPALLNGVYQIRMNVAVEDAGGDALTDEEKQDIRDAIPSDLHNGTISFAQETKEFIEARIATAVSIIQAIPNTAIANQFQAVYESEVIAARHDLNQIFTQLNQIEAHLDGLFPIEMHQYVNSLAYATAYGAVMFTEQNPGHVVDSLFGGL